MEYYNFYGFSLFTLRLMYLSIIGSSMKLIYTLSLVFVCTNVYVTHAHDSKGYSLDAQVDYQYPDKTYLPYIRLDGYLGQAENSKLIVSVIFRGDKRLH